jgi:hypothetical protein
MEGCVTVRQVAEWNPQGQRRTATPVKTWKDRIRDSMQIRNLKDRECFDRELRRKKIVEENCVFTEYIRVCIHTHT